MRIRVFAGIAVLVGAAAGGVLVANPAAAAQNCPASPAPGSTVNGNLNVVGGDCELNNVTVNGSVTIQGGAGLEMVNSRVAGSITVNPDGELDVQHELDSS